MDPADSTPARPKALFILDRDRLDDIYGPDEWQEIEGVVKIVAPPQTPSSIRLAPQLLRVAEILFTGPGTARIDGEFLESAPNLKAVFHGSDSIAEYFDLAVWQRGIKVIGGVNAEGRRMGRCMVDELHRYLAGADLQWGVNAPGHPAGSEPEMVAASEPVPPSPAPNRATSPASKPAPPAAASGAKPPRLSLSGRLRKSLFLIVSIFVHLIFFGAATYYVVAQYTTKRKTVFKSENRAPLPSQRALEHQVQMAKKQKMGGAPPLAMKRIAISGTSKISLPEMPAMPAMETMNRPAMPMAGAGSGTGFGSSSSAGTGTKMGGGGIGGGVPITFFGIRDAGESVVVMIDVSDSMFTRTGDAEGRSLVKTGAAQSFQTIRDEAIKLVKALPAGTRFGIVRWSGGAYAWQPELVKATEENKTAAIAHIETTVDMKSARPKGGRPGGTRHDYALEEAFLLKPEMIYMLTDGNATAAQPGGGLKPIEAEDIWKVAAAGQKALPKPARLHVIYYLTGADREDERKMLRTLATRNGGKFREVEARGRK